MDKDSLRKEASARRSAYSQETLRALSARLENNFLRLSDFARAQTLATYVSKGSEVETRGIISKALADGKRVLIPLTLMAQGALVFSVLHHLEDLAPGPFGILEPKPDFVQLVNLEEAQLVLVPGLAWDIRGYRLGYGGGYFDKALAGLSGNITLVGLSFELQLISKIPSETHDKPVHILVTEERVIRCKENVQAIN
ncbi:MAG: 5-formyltetrahydrofolate cyclo-ligase [Candidatus Bathyarchaeia archaeon]